jgi:glycine oxidase
VQDCIVLGGGAVGCAIAWRLAQRKLRVTLVERGLIGGEATWAAAGILAPQAESPSPGPLFDLLRHSRELWPAFAAELVVAADMEVGYRPTGTLVVDGDPDRFEWQRALGLRVERRGTSVFLPDDHQVEPRLLASALGAAALFAGVTLRPGLAQAVVREGSHIGLLVDGDRLETRHLVIAAGAWSSQLPGLPPLPEVRPLRGQMLELRAAPDLVPHILYGEGGYLVPRADGRVLCGSSEDDVGFQKEVTPPVLARLLERALRLEPRLAQAAVSGFWAGFRPATADRLPLLGTAAPGLHLATAHHRNGILLAPLTAELIAALVTGEAPPADIAAFSPAREMHASR